MACSLLLHTPEYKRLLLIQQQYTLVVDQGIKWYQILVCRKDRRVRTGGCQQLFFCFFCSRALVFFAGTGRLLTIILRYVQYTPNTVLVRKRSGRAKEKGLFRKQKLLAFSPWSTAVPNRGQSTWDWSGLSPRTGLQQQKGLSPLSTAVQRENKTKKR